jgi:hypothetical protein
VRKKYKRREKVEEIKVKNNMSATSSHPRERRKENVNCNERNRRRK